MNEKVCAAKGCSNAFRPKREDQRFCSSQCRNEAWKKPRKRRLRCTPRGSVAKAPFSSSKSVPCKPPSTPSLGAFVRAQILAQKDQPNPIRFTTPDGTRGRVWLASDKNGSRIIGDDRHWRLNVPAASRVDRDERNKRVTATLADIWQTELGFPPMGFRARVGIEAEKELQALGCGWRIVTCQFRGDKVLLHHNGNKATMKRAAFKALLAANKRVRGKRPRLAVSNVRPMPAREAA